MADPTDKLTPIAGSNGVSDAGGAGGGTRPEAELEAVEAALGAVGDDDDHEEEEGEGDKEEAKPSRVQRRIKQLVDRTKAYSKYGKPEDLERQLSRLRLYEELEAKVQREAAEQDRQSRVQTGAADRSARFRELLDETFGEGSSDQWERTMRSQQAVEDQVNAAHAKEARVRLAQVLEENHLNTDPKVVQTFEHMMSTYIKANDELLEKYRNPSTQSEAIDESFRFLRSTMIDPVLAVANAGTLSSIVERKSRALGSGRGTSSAVIIDDDRPPANILKDPDALSTWHKQRASRMWDAAIAADEGDGA